MPRSRLLALNFSINSLVISFDVRKWTSFSGRSFLTLTQFSKSKEIKIAILQAIDYASSGIINEVTAEISSESK